MRLITPYPPSTNVYWRSTVVKGRVRTYKSAEAKAFAEHVRLANLHAEPLDGAICVTVNVYRPRKSGDLDNRIKPLLDALQGVAYRDDVQVVQIHAYRYDDKHNPRAEVIVTRAVSQVETGGLRRRLRDASVRVRRPERNEGVSHLMPQSLPDAA